MTNNNLNQEFTNTTPGGEQLSASFAVYAEEIQNAYAQIQGLLDQHTHQDNRRAVEALETVVESQQKMLQRMRTLA